MKRTEKTIQQYKQQIIDKRIDNIPEFVELIISADITKGKYTRFLLDCFIADKFRLEDLKGGLESTIGQAISLFHKHKAKLPEDMRSVTKYNSPGDLWQAVKEYETVLTGKEEKRSEKEKAYAETEFIYNDEITGFQIVSPLTEYSAKWWGKGTRWCTAADKENQFDYYAKQAPLFVILMPKGEKLQLWRYKDSIQFMDEADNNVERSYIEQNWQYLKELCLSLDNWHFLPINHIDIEKHLENISLYRLPMEIIDNKLAKRVIKNNYRNFDTLPSKIINYELCQWAVEQNGLVIDYIPEKYKTPELYKLAVQQNGKSIKYIEHEHQTYELCQLAIKQNVNSIIYLADQFKTSELYHLAIQENGIVLRYVPNEYKTQEICNIAVRTYGRSFLYIPDKYITNEICEITVKQDGMVLEYIPEEYKTPELYKLAIEQNGQALVFVPEEYKTPELCKLAIEQDGIALSYVPEKYKTSELCKLAIKKSGHILQYVPEQLKTFDLCKLAIEKNGSGLEFVPEELKTSELCEIVINVNPMGLNHIPYKYKTLELCKMAIEKNGQSLEYVPEKYKTFELCQIAVEQCYKNFDFIPKSKRNYNLYKNLELKTLKKLFEQYYFQNKFDLDFLKAFFEKDGYYLKKINHRFQTEELCKIALNNYGESLKYVNKELKTLELCQIALDQTSLAYSYIPKEYLDKIIIPPPYVVDIHSPENEEYLEIFKGYKEKQIYTLSFSIKS